MLGKSSALSCRICGRKLGYDWDGHGWAGKEYGDGDVLSAFGEHALCEVRRQVFFDFKFAHDTLLESSQP